jgi:AcrR family transcriptional regulator
MGSARGSAPARPRNRRALILAAASDQLYRRGYDHVSMSDIARAVQVGPSALYRHFSSKQELLTDVVLDELRPFDTLLADPRELEPVLAELAETALEHRRLGVLWQREARHLRQSRRDELKEQLRGVASGLAALARAHRPELTEEDARFRAWCVFSALTSPSYHQVQLPRTAFTAVLQHMAHAVLDLEPNEFTRSARASGQRSELLDRRVSRRGLLLSAATRLFADHGYAAVTTEDIGTAAGIAGPSVYHHFTSKQELLDAAITRGSAWLELELERILTAAREPAEALRTALRSYISFAYDYGGFIDLLIGEVNHLPEAARHRARQTQHDYIAEWVALLVRARPELEPDTARVLVQAAVTIANDMSRTGTTRDVGALLRVGETIMFDTPCPDVNDEK